MIIIHNRKTQVGSWKLLLFVGMWLHVMLHSCAWPLHFVAWRAIKKKKKRQEHNTTRFLKKSGGAAVGSFPLVVKRRRRRKEMKRLRPSVWSVASFDSWSLSFWLPLKTTTTTTTTIMGKQFAVVTLTTNQPHITTSCAFTSSSFRDLFPFFFFYSKHELRKRERKKIPEQFASQSLPSWVESCNLMSRQMSPPLN